MYVFDASSMIDAWEYYPKEQFPTVWTWLAVEITNNHLSMIERVVQEVANKLPDCEKWLKKIGLKPIEISDRITQKADEIKHSLDINNSEYHSKGVNENDLLIIAHAAIAKKILVTEEGVQINKPEEEKRRYKIPAVCDKHRIKHCAFIDFLKDSKKTF